MKKKKRQTKMVALCRIEATRTPDPYVPNVVRYQLRYYPNAYVKRCKDTPKMYKTQQISKEIPVIRHILVPKAKKLPYNLSV